MSATTIQRRQAARLDARALITGERRALLGVVALSLLATLAEAGFLVLVARAGVALANGDNEIVLYGERSVSMAFGLACAGGFVTLRFFAGLGATGLSSLSMARATIRLRRAFTSAYLGTAWDEKHALAPGRVQQLLSNHTRTAVNVVAATARALTALASLVALIAVALGIQPWITLIATGLVVGLGMIMLPLRRAVQRATTRAADAQVTFGTRVNEMESLTLEIDVHGVRDPAAQRVDDDAVEAARALGWSQFAQLAIGPTYQLVAYGGVVGLLVVGISTGVDDIGTVGAVLVLLLRCLGYGQSLQVARAQYVQAEVYATGLADEMDRFRHAAPQRGSERSSAPAGIAATALDFAYDDVPTLHGLTFEVPTGSVVGVVGPSGSGKSTLTQLLLGLRSSSGALTFDGVAIDDADPGWWSRQVALVPQHSNLLTGTVAENVRFLRPEITDDDIEGACRRAAVHDEIVAMGGYDASVGERGGALSGGQRQRLCIARALAGGPRLLVLDEPTSALDAESERAVLDALASLDDDTTIVAITHRLAVLDICDQVLRLDDGRIDFCGSAVDYRAIASGGPS
ncbi:MAG: ABC transporter ATP-binding protein [Actinomycetota bacterium]